jgi:outer membrane protein OmpA-like peptidoglycan-associated protein
MKKYYYSAVIIALLLLVLPFAVAAQKGGQPSAGCGDSPYGSVFVYKFFPRDGKVRSGKYEVAGGETIELMVQKGFFPTTDPSGAPFPIPYFAEGDDNGHHAGDPDQGRSFRAQYPNFENTMNAIEIPTQGWYTIISGRKILLPFKEKISYPSDNEIDKEDKPVSTVVLNFDTRGVAFGTYDLVLYNDAAFKELSPVTCAKFTPSVLMQIVKLEDHTPTLELTDGRENCFPHTVTAVANDEDNGPDSQVTHQILTLEWQVFDQNNKRIYLKPGDWVIKRYGNPDEPNYTEKATINSGLIQGRYTVKVTVRDNKYEVLKQISFDLLCPEPVAVAALYYQFDESKVDVPRSVTLKKNEQKSKCTEPYPSAEYVEFYKNHPEAGAPPASVELNKTKLDAIAVKLLDADKNVYLYIEAYADFKGPKNYNEAYNCCLASDRATSAKAYLETNYPGLKGRIKITVINHGNLASSSRENDNCLDQRKWDRRVELYYLFVSEGGSGDSKPVCSTGPCPFVRVSHKAKKPHKNKSPKRYR